MLPRRRHALFSPLSLPTPVRAMAATSSHGHATRTRYTAAIYVFFDVDAAASMLLISSLMLLYVTPRDTLRYDADACLLPTPYDVYDDAVTMITPRRYAMLLSLPPLL